MNLWPSRKYDEMMFEERRDQARAERQRDEDDGSHEEARLERALARQRSKQSPELVFIKKDCVDLAATALGIAGNIIDGKDESWPHRIAELRALLEDMEHYAAKIYGGPDRWATVVAQTVSFNG